MDLIVDVPDIVTAYYLDSFHDDEIGRADTCHHAISVWFDPTDAEVAGHGYAIQLTDSQGFVSTSLFDSFTEWQEEWRLIVNAHTECCSTDDD